MFYCVGDWDDLQVDEHVSLHVAFKRQFADIVLVFFEFNARNLNVIGRSGPVIYSSVVLPV